MKDSSNVRKPGYYWVRINYNWLIAEYDKDMCWMISGSDLYVDEKHLQEIDETPITRNEPAMEKETMKFMKVHSASFQPGVLHVPSKVPYSLLSEVMAQRNHSQSLDRLNERGGMSVLEILDNIHNRRSDFNTKENQSHVDELNKFIEEKALTRNEAIIEDLKDKLQKMHDGYDDAIEKVRNENEAITRELVEEVKKALAEIETACIHSNPTLVYKHLGFAGTILKALITKAEQLKQE